MPLRQCEWVVYAQRFKAYEMQRFVKSVQLRAIGVREAT
jgi:hypothetical protein